MFNCHGKVILLSGIAIYVAIALGFAGGCTTPDQYKKQADEEVHKIIEDKWNERFGHNTNYEMSDVEQDPNVLISPEVKSEIISLSQAVTIATANNREYQGQKEDLYTTALDLTWARHAFVAQWFGTIDASYTRDASDEGLDSDSKFGFSQMLADGAVISANIAMDWARFLTGDRRMTLLSVLNATISQPLLRGAGRKIAQESLTQAERKALYQIRTFSRFRKTFVVSVVSDYYRVLQKRDTVTNAFNDYQRRLQSKDRLAMEAQAGRRKKFEVDQAHTDVLKARDQYVRAQREYEQALDEFKIKLALPTDAVVELDQNELKALVNVEITKPDYTVEMAIETALEQRLDLVTTRDRVDDSKRKIEVAINNFEAKLDIVGSANVGSAGKTDFGKIQFHNGTYTLGLDVDLPFDRKKERNDYRKALIALNRQQRQYEAQLDNVKLNIRQAYRELDEASQRYEIQQNSLELAKKRVESTMMLLEAGRTTTRDLLESQDALLDAQVSLTTAIVNHAVAKLNFFRDVGVLQVKPDGMWTTN